MLLLFCNLFLHFILHVVLYNVLIENFRNLASQTFPNDDRIKIKNMLNAEANADGQTRQNKIRLQAYQHG